MKKGYESYDILKTCNKRLTEVLPKQRMKSIANPLRSQIIQVHYTDHKVNTPIDFEKDMVLIHFKRNKDLREYNLTTNATPFVINDVIHSFLKEMDAQRSNDTFE